MAVAVAGIGDAWEDMGMPAKATSGQIVTVLEDLEMLDRIDMVLRLGLAGVICGAAFGSGMAGGATGCSPDGATPADDLAVPVWGCGCAVSTAHGTCMHMAAETLAWLTRQAAKVDLLPSRQALVSAMATTLAQLERADGKTVGAEAIHERHERMEGAGTGTGPIEPGGAEDAPHARIAGAG